MSSSTARAFSIEQVAQLLAPKHVDPVFNQRSVFIVSTGRTGTQFLAQGLGRMMDGVHALHEPDSIWLDRPREYLTSEWWKQVQRHGLVQMTVGQLHNTPAHLSAARHTGRIDDEVARKRLRGLRRGVLRQAGDRVYVESNGLLYGVADLVLDELPNSRMVMVVRDPRDWIRSAVKASHFRAYKAPDFDFLGLSVRPYQFANSEVSRSEWEGLPLAHKYAWLWSAVNQQLVDTIGQSNRVLAVRYEDLFSPAHDYRSFRRLLDFCSRWDNGHHLCRLEREFLARKVDSSRDLTAERAPETEVPTAVLERLCGELMRRFGYAL